MRGSKFRNKISKQKADYGSGMKSSHCGICKHFQSPDACEVVEGKISPKAWCKYFAKKTKKWVVGQFEK